MDLRIETQLAEFAVGTRYVNIPEDVVEFAKSLALKTVAGMVAGAAKPAGRKFARLIRDRRLNEEVGVIGGGFKTSLWEAVQLHQFFAHASELEDDKFGEGFSWDITVIPLLFPLAEKLRLSGKALIEAIVVGLEVDARIGLFPSDRSGVKVISHTGAVGPAV
ncbi:MAG: MmgE/PrpD family protein, partial [Dehalococcoidia bacterium]|nr:MmgE/PrpD family protein [Dehalococcoidia bacterium]